MSRNCCHWWMQSLPWPADAGVRAAVLNESKAIEPTTRNRTVENCVNVASNRCWPNVAPHMAAAWEFIAGWSNEPTVGCINSAVFASATNAAPTSTKHS